MAITRPNVDQHYKQHFRSYQTLLRRLSLSLGMTRVPAGLQRLATSRAAIYANLPSCAVARRSRVPA